MIISIRFARLWEDNSNLRSREYDTSVVKFSIAKITFKKD
jgi:hypothetical protein